MDAFRETDVSRAILDAYHAKFARALRRDVAIVGAGPSVGGAPRELLNARERRLRVDPVGVSVPAGGPRPGRTKKRVRYMGIIQPR